MQFLIHVGEALFQCVQGHRFVGIRGCHDCRVTFMEGADKILNKIQTTEGILSLHITFSHDFVEQTDNEDLNIYKFLLRRAPLAQIGYTSKFCGKNSWSYMTGRPGIRMSFSSVW